MAQMSLAKFVSKSNFNSHSHILLYQKLLFLGSQMASMLKYYDCHIGLPKAMAELADNWENLILQLAEVLL